MNMHVGTVNLAVEAEKAKLQRFFAAINLAKEMPAPQSGEASNERWVASWRFCPN